MSNIRSIINLGGSPCVTIPRELGFKKGDSVLVEKIDDNSCKIIKVEYLNSKDHLEYINKCNVDKSLEILDEWINNNLKKELSNINVDIEKIKTFYERKQYTNLHISVGYKIYTKYYMYVITAIIPSDNLEKIGVMSLLSTRRPLKGEIHVRMSDMNDGDLTFITLKHIKNEILKNEINHEMEMKSNSIEYENFELEPFEFLIMYKDEEELKKRFGNEFKKLNLDIYHKEMNKYKEMIK